MQSTLRAAVLAFAIAQPVTPQFAGTWTAELHGTTYVRLTLLDTGGRLTGSVSLGNVHLNAQGEVDAVNVPPRAITPIFDVQLRDGVLSFARKDGDDTDRFEMRVVNGEAELLFLPSAEDREALAREGVPLPRPIRLTKTPR